MAKKKRSKKSSTRKSSTRTTSSRRTRRSTESQPPQSLDSDLSQGLEGGGAGQGQTTGRMIMTVLDDGAPAVRNAVDMMSNMTGMSSTPSRMMHSRDFGDEEMPIDDASDANFIVLEECGVVILNGDPNEVQVARSATPQDQNVVVEPEYWNVPLGFEAQVGGFADEQSSVLMDEGGDSTMSREFLLGARKVLDLLLEQQSMTSRDVNSSISAQCFQDDMASTWGLQATNVAMSPLSGNGVKVAVLDTGFDSTHPDFAGRNVRRATFIPASEPDNDVNDRNGHGTHCIGTACGPRNPGIGPRYGVAHGAEIFSGKVLRQGSGGGASGADGWILAGINWALANDCEIISMSLGSRAGSSQFPMMYERTAQRGLRRGTLILAATGNDSNRRVGFMDAVNRPANCPSIASVSAADSCLRVARFFKWTKDLETVARSIFPDQELRFFPVSPCPVAVLYLTAPAWQRPMPQGSLH